MTATYPIESTSFYNGVTGMFTIQLVWPEKPFTMNKANTDRWGWITARREWRTAYELMSKDHDQLDWCDITVDHLLSTRRGVDVGAVMPTVKAAVDGCVRGGLLLNDTPRFVRSLLFNAPVYAGVDALVLTLVGPPALEVAS